MRRHDEEAFPRVEMTDSSSVVWGLTVREYFAAKAMQGLMAASTALPLDGPGLIAASIRMADEIIQTLETSEPFE